MGIQNAWLQIQMKWIWRFQTISVGKCRSTYPLILGWTAFASLNRSGEQRTADVGLSHSFSLQTGCLSLESPGEGPFPESKPCSWVSLVKSRRSVQTKENCPWIRSRRWYFWNTWSPKQVEVKFGTGARNSKSSSRSSKNWLHYGYFSFCNFLSGNNYTRSVWVGCIF